MVYAGALKVLIDGVPIFDESPNDQSYWKKLNLGEAQLSLIKMLLSMNEEIAAMTGELLLEVLKAVSAECVCAFLTALWPLAKPDAFNIRFEFNVAGG